MPDIGIPELLVLLAIVIVFFGPSRIAGVGKSLGEAIGGFRREARDEGEHPPVGEERNA